MKLVSINKSTSLEASVVNTVLSDLQLHCLDEHNEQKVIVGLTLADPQYYITGRVDILLGSDIFMGVVSFEGK